MSIRLVVASDFHADRNMLGVPRFREVREAVLQSVRHAIDVEADAYLFLGDLADPDSGGSTMLAMQLAIEAALALQRAGVRSFWIAGNHDVEEDGTATTCLSQLAAISESRLFGDRIEVAETPRWYGVTSRNRSDELLLACFPYPAIATSYSPTKFAEACKIEAQGRRLVVAAHLMINGVVPGEETNELPRGRDVLFPVVETETAVLRLNGHYHRRQTTREGIVIPGAIARLAFGPDEENEPSFLEILV